MSLLHWLEPAWAQTENPGQEEASLGLGFSIPHPRSCRGAADPSRPFPWAARSELKLLCVLPSVCEGLSLFLSGSDLSLSCL